MKYCPYVFFLVIAAFVSLFRSFTWIIFALALAGTGLTSHCSLCSAEVWMCD